MLVAHSRSTSRGLLVALTFILSVFAGIASADDSKFPFGCPVKEGYVNVTGGKVWYEIVGAGDATPLITLHGGPVLRTTIWNRSEFFVKKGRSCSMTSSDRENPIIRTINRSGRSTAS